MQYTNSEMDRRIAETIHSERDRQLMRRRLIDGRTYDELSVEFFLSRRQVARIIARAKLTLTTEHPPDGTKRALPRHCGGALFCFILETERRCIIVAYIEYNPNPQQRETGDCVIRAIAKATGDEWEKVYMALTLKGLQLSAWGDTNIVWEAYLKDKGFLRQVIPNYCPDCYSIEEFAKDHPTGTFIVATGTHVVCVKDGDIYDSWNSSQLVPSYYFYREEDAK